MIIIGQDGESHGARLYLNKATVQESEDTAIVCVFPFGDWLDTHLGAFDPVSDLKPDVGHEIGKT